MADTSDAPVTAATVHVLADYARVILPREREELLAPLLKSWIEGCLALNQKMAAAEYHEILPMTLLAQFPEEVEGAGHDCQG